MKQAADILRNVAGLIEGDRRDTHGDAEETYRIAAAYWSVRLGITITPGIIMELMTLLKMARRQGGGPAQDHFMDMAGYAALAGAMQAPGTPSEEPNDA